MIVDACYLFSNSATQVRLLGGANHHWSADAYLLHDAPCHISFQTKRHGRSLPTVHGTTVPGFSLASLYKPRGMTPVRYIIDQEERSPVPVLSMRKIDYFMLGK